MTETAVGSKSEQAYAAVKAEKLLRQEPARLPEDQLVNWLAR